MPAVRGSVMRSASHLWRWTCRSSALGTAGGSRGMSTSGQMLDKKLDGKIAIITGGVGGIGYCVAKHFAAHGAQVILADVLPEEAGRKKASEIGSSTHYKLCDVAKENDVASTVDFAMDKFGKLDIMFNNAGVITPKEDVETLNLDDYDRFHGIMVRGVLAGIKHAARVMIPVKQGAILTTASVAANFTSAEFPLAYNICKSNIPGLTKVAAFHLGKHGIRVNAISPHAILTPLNLNWLSRLGVDATFEEAEQAHIDNSSLLGKRLKEEDIAMSALFLCGDDSRYISGQTLRVDGGWCNHKESRVAKDLLALAKRKKEEGRSAL